MIPQYPKISDSIIDLSGTFTFLVFLKLVHWVQYEWKILPSLFIGFVIGESIYFFTTYKRRRHKFWKYLLEHPDECVEGLNRAEAVIAGKSRETVEVN